MERYVIHIFGASGSGTTTLGRFLAEGLGWIHLDADDYFWEPTNPPFSVKRGKEERIALLRRDLELHPKAVLSGSLCGWGDDLIPDFTLAIRLHTDTELRLARIRTRERERFGDRLDPGGDLCETHQEFLRWTAAYDCGGPDMRSRLRHDAWQKLLQCPVIALDGSLALQDLRNAILPYITSSFEKGS